MTRGEAHTLLEIMAINLTGAIANNEEPVTEQTKLMAKQIKAIDMAIEALSNDRPSGEWVLDPNGLDWNLPAWRCSECGFVASYIGVEANCLGNNPTNWAGSKFCPNCGAIMKGDSE